MRKTSHFISICWRYTELLWRSAGEGSPGLPALCSLPCAPCPALLCTEAQEPKGLALPSGEAELTPGQGGSLSLWGPHTGVRSECCVSSVFCCDHWVAVSRTHPGHVKGCFVASQVMKRSRLSNTPSYLAESEYPSRFS